MRVIARKGMSAATMQEIAAEAGVAKGTIYLYFRDRDELVERTFETAVGDLQRRIAAALELDLPFDERLREIVRAKVVFFEENAEFFRLYTSLRNPEGSPQQQRRRKRTCQPQYEAHVRDFARVLEQAMERGEVRRLDPMRLSLFIIEGCSAIIHERLTEADPPSEEIDIDFLVSVALDGVSLRKQKRGSH